jgi:hypothetical protein
VNFFVSAAPPTRIGTRIPAAFRSSAVTTICCALFTSSPDRPMMSGLCFAASWMSTSGGTLIPRLTTR